MQKVWLILEVEYKQVRQQNQTKQQLELEHKLDWIGSALTEPQMNLDLQTMNSSNDLDSTANLNQTS